LIANAQCERIAASVWLDRSRQTSRSGGDSDTELTALTVVPTGAPSDAREVTTVTPVAKCPSAWRTRS
jgi:hypothetical protein